MPTLTIRENLTSVETYYETIVFPDLGKKSKIDLVNDFIQIEDRRISIVAIDPKLIVAGNSLKSIFLPNEKSSDGSILDLNITALSNSSFVVSGGKYSNAYITLKDINFPILMYDYTTTTINYGNSQILAGDISVIHTYGQSPRKNIWIIGHEIKEVFAPNNSEFVAAFLDPRVLSRQPANLANSNYNPNNLIGNFTTSLNEKPILSISEFGTLIGNVHYSQVGATSLSLTDYNDIHIGGFDNLPVDILSSKGNDLIIFRNNKDVYSFWDDFQGSNLSPLPTIIVDLENNYCNDGWGGRDTLINVSNVRGSLFNSMKIIGNEENNKFSVYGNNDIINGGKGIDLINIEKWDINVDYEKKIIKDNTNKHLANFENIEAVVVDGFVNVRGNEEDNILIINSGRGGGATLGPGNDTVVFVETIPIQSLKIDLDGGLGVDAIYLYSRFAESAIYKSGDLLSISIGITGRLGEFWRWHDTQDARSVFTQYELGLSRGLVDLNGFEKIYFVDGEYDIATNTFKERSIDFTLINELTGFVRNVNPSSDSFSLPQQFLDLNYFNNPDLRFDQTTDRKIYTGNGDDIVVGRYGSEISTSAGNDSILFIGDKINAVSGTGNDNIMIAFPLSGGQIDGGSDFDLLTFLNKEDYESSILNTTILNIELVFIQGYGFKITAAYGDNIIAPFFEPNLAVYSNYFDRYIYHGRLNIDGNSFDLLSNSSTKSALIVPLMNNYIFYGSNKISENIQYFSLDSFSVNLIFEAQAFVLGKKGVSILSLDVIYQPVSIQHSVAIIQLLDSKRLFTYEIERLNFSDKSLAIDLDGNSGNAARLLATVFGKDAIKNPTYAGIAISLFDQGYSKDQVSQVALNAVFGANAKSKDVVSLIWKNLTGLEIDSKNLADLSGLIDSKAITAAQLATKAADLDLTAQVIDLVGLGKTGWEYIPFGG